MIPESWALPVAAFAIGIGVEEARAMVDAGELELTVESVARVALKRDLALLELSDG